MPTISQPLKTAAQVWEEFAEAGISLAEWCRAHKLSYDVARSVMSGRIKATRGEAHRIAVALGLKQGRVVAPRMFAPPPKPSKPKLSVVRGDAS